MDVHVDTSALPTGDGLWPLPRHVSWRSRKVAEFARGRAAIERMKIKHVLGYSPMSLVFMTRGSQGFVGQSSPNLAHV